jgi:hypothetical protein
MARKPPQLPLREALTETQIGAARYVGSPEHKTRRWWGGLPEAFADSHGTARRPDKQDTTICTLTAEADRIQATEWVQKALKASQFRYYEGDKDYPKKIWYQDETSGQLWFGQCVNSVRGEYKGWQIDEEERREIFG